MGNMLSPPVTLVGFRVARLSFPAEAAALKAMLGDQAALV